jgi:hypothetical protein
MNRNSTIAAAVAAILGTAAGAQSALAQVSNPPSLANATSAGVTLYIAGSSAAKNAVLGALQADICGGASNALTFTSTSNGNFFAVSCAPASGKAGADGNTYYTIYYRDEGGSVVGALPIVNNVPVLTLDLTQISSCATTTVCNPTVIGGSTANGANDSFTGPLTLQPVQLGILDVEPSAIATANNYPTGYSTAVWGPSNAAGLVSINGSAAALFDEVYGIYVNESSTGANFTESPLLLSKQMVEQILTRSVSNWSAVTDVNGNPVTSGSLAITVVNREPGSGSRAAADLLIAGDTCQTQGKHLIGSTGYFSTSDVLGAANSVAGAITYATIDQSASNMTKVWLNGISPSNLAAATGAYDFWVEATTLTNPNVSYTPLQTAFLSYFTSELQAIATAPHLADVLANPSVGGNTAAVNTAGTASLTTVPGLGTFTIYINPFTRGKVTCALPSYAP